MSDENTGRGVLARLSRKAGYMATIIGALTLLATGLSTGLFHLFPDLLPDKNEHSSATLKVLGIEHGIGAPSDYGPETKTCRSGPSHVAGVAGAVVNLQYHVEGYKHAHLKLRCGVFDSDLQTPVEQPDALGDFVTLPSQKTTDDTAILPVWVSVPSYSGDLSVQVALYSDSGELLASTSSPPFPGGVLSSPAVRAATSSEEAAVVRAIMRSPISKEVHGRQYVSPVAILRVGGAVTRGAWALAELRFYLRFDQPNGAVETVLHKSHGRWSVQQLDPRGPGCDIPDEVLVAFHIADACG